MGKKRRPPPSPADKEAAGPFHTGLAGLAKLKAQLPQAEAQPSEPVEETNPSPQPVTSAELGGKLIVRHERKGHGGKTLTVLQGVGGEDDQLQTLAQELSQALGCRVRVQEGELRLGGDQRTRLTAWLHSRGARQVVSGT